MKPFLIFTLILICFSAIAQTTVKKSTSTPAQSRNKKLSADFFGFPGVRQSTTGIKPNEITITAPNGDVMRFVTVGKYFTFVLKKENEIVKQVRKKMPASRKQKDALVKTAIAKKGPAYYTLTQQMIDEHDAIDKAYETVTTNRINLADPLQRRNNNENPTAAHEAAPATPEWIKNTFQEIKDYAKSIEGRTAFDLPKPPAIDLACNLCQKDSTVRQKSESVRGKYSEQIFKQENDALENSFKIYRAYHLDLGEPASMKTMINELEESRTVIFRQILLKCEKLLDEYGKDLEALIHIIPIVLQKERARQLIDAGNGEDDTRIMEKIAGLLTFSAIQTFIDKKLVAKDFRYIINPAPLIGLSRQSMLLGGMDENEYQDLVAKIIDNNRFEYQSTIDIKRTFAGKEGNVNLEAVFVSEPLFYMVAETRDCRLVLIPDTGFQTVYSKNRLVSYNIKSMRHSECTYSGPKQLQVPSPVIHLDFCADTARLEYTFETDWMGFEEKWSCEHAGNEDFIKNLLSEGYYNRVDDQKEQMAELTDSDERLAAFQQMHSAKDPPITNLEEMKKHYPKSIETGQKSYDFRQFIMKVPLANFQSTLIEEKLDGKQTHDADDERFEYSWLRIRLDHAPKISSK